MSESRPAISAPDATARPTAGRCEIVRDFAQLEALAKEWDRIWSADPRGEVFQSFAWNRAWWKACGSSVELCTPVVHAGSEVLGILPLVRRRNQSRARLEFLGSPHADYGDVICAEEHTVEVLTSSLRELQNISGWHEGCFDGLPEDSRIVRHAAQLPADVRANLQLFASERCYTILLGEQPAEVLDGLARKQHLRRRQNKLEKAGKVVFRHVEDVSEALQHLELFFISQRRRRAIHGKSSAAESDEFRELLRNLVQDFDLKRDLHFGVLELDSKPLAWHFSFEAHDKWVFYQQTFDVDAWDFAPGEALLRYLLLFAKGRVGREFDFTRGDEPFKARFGNHERVIYQMWLQPHGLRGKVVGIARKIAGAVQGRMRLLRAAAKAHKGFFERWRSARTWLQQRSQQFAGRGAAGGAVVSSGTEGEPSNASSFSMTSLWQNETVTLFASSAVPVSRDSSQAASVSPAGLGDLVDFAQNNPRVILPTQVLNLRERFRKGDLAFVEREGTQPVRVAWMTRRPLGEMVELPPQCAELGAAMILYDLWEAQPAIDSLSPFFNALRQNAASQQLPLWILSSQDARALRGAAERIGFSKILEIHRQKIFAKTIREIVRQGAQVPKF